MLDFGSYGLGFAAEPLLEPRWEEIEAMLSALDLPGEHNPEVLST